MLEISLPYSTYTYMIEPSAPTNVSGIEANTYVQKFHPVKRKSTFLLFQKEGTGKEGDCQKG